jgi:hypothetical protein
VITGSLSSDRRGIKMVADMKGGIKKIMTNLRSL